MAWWQILILGVGALVLAWALGAPLLSRLRSAGSEPSTREILDFLPRLAGWCDTNGIDGQHTWIAIRHRCSEIDTPLPGDREDTH